MNSSDEIVYIGDIHLGHTNTPTSHIIESLHQAIPNTVASKKIRLIILAGDVFERLLTYADECVFEIHLWIVCLLHLCKQNGIILVILEGTPSHDNKQSRWFIEINNSGIGADVMYIEQIEIVYLRKLELRILFIPDEINATCLITQEIVKEKLREQNLEKVNYSVIHGSFPHQLPPNSVPPEKLHDPDFYQSITEDYVLVSHIHFHSQYGRIIAAGSLDRLRHGEEDKKGHVRIRYTTTGKQLLFIENKNAMPYVTVNVTDMNEQDTKKAIEKAMGRLPEQAYVKIKCRRTDPGLAAYMSLVNSFAQYQFTYDEVKSKEEIDRETVAVSFQVVPINANNIESRLLERVLHKHPAHLETAQQQLREALSE